MATDLQTAINDSEIVERKRAPTGPITGAAQPAVKRRKSSGLPSSPLAVPSDTVIEEGVSEVIERAPGASPQGQTAQAAAAAYEVDTNVYCVCRGRDDGRFMVCCDSCQEWYHGQCVGISRKAAEGIAKYYCPKCVTKNPSFAALMPSLSSSPSPTPTNASPRPGVVKISAGGANVVIKTPGATEPPAEESPGSRRSARVAGRPRSVINDETYAELEDDYEEEEEESPRRKRSAGTKSPPKSKQPSTPKSAMASASKTHPVTETTRQSVLEKLVPILENRQELAQSLELALYKLNFKSSRNYTSKFRSLEFNLKDTKNPTLKERVLSGEIAPDALAEMTPQQLANPELVSYRKSREQKSLEGVVVQEGMAPALISEKVQAEKAVKVATESISAVPATASTDDSARENASAHIAANRTDAPIKKIRITSPKAVPVASSTTEKKDYHGFVDKPGFPKFAVNGKLICGRVIDTSQVPAVLEISGRLATGKLTTYMGQLNTSLTRKRSVLLLEPTTESDRAAWQAVFQYFSARDRAGHMSVKGLEPQNAAGFEDIYLLPWKEMLFPDFMRIDPSFTPPTGTENDRLLLVIVSRCNPPAKPARPSGSSPQQSAEPAPKDVNMADVTEPQLSGDILEAK